MPLLPLGAVLPPEVPPPLVRVVLAEACPMLAIVCVGNAVAGRLVTGMGTLGDVALGGSTSMPVALDVLNGPTFSSRGTGLVVYQLPSFGE